MRAVNYIRYFFYIGLNWTARLAFFTLYHEIRGESRYHLNTTGINDLKKLTLKGRYRKQAEVYQGANYLMVEMIFQQLRSLGVNQSIVDFGCGKGRVLIVAAHYGFTDITGVEFARELWEDAMRNINALKARHPSARFRVLYENAVDYQVEDHTQVFFFFNPFQEPVMKKVIEHILRSYRQSRRPIYIMYVNPQLKNLFLQEGFREIGYVRKMEYVEASLLLLDK